MNYRERSGGEGSIASEVTSRVRSILSAAEDTAAVLEREARERADERLKDAESEADELLVTARREAGALVGGAKDKLRQALSGLEEPGEQPGPSTAEAAGRLNADPPAAGAGGGAAIGGAANRGRSPREPFYARPAPGGGNGPGSAVDGRERFDGPRQVALQMVAAGSTRAEVAAHLRRTFDVQDSSAVLNDVFGEPGVRN
jgi:hypothetical protein